MQFDIYSYDGSADCVTAIENGEIDATFTQPSPAVASLKAGTLSMLGVLANERLSGFPDVPTIVETYGEDYNLVMMGWVALTAPKGTPDEVIETLSDVMGKALRRTNTKSRFSPWEWNILYCTAMS